MTDTLTLWLTVIGTLTGFVSMCLAWLDRRGPKPPRQGPSRFSIAADKPYTAVALLAASGGIIGGPVMNGIALWHEFSLNNLGCAACIVINICSMSLVAINFDRHRHKNLRRAYFLFSLIFILIYIAVAIIR
ncbi:hypothetical protein [Streptomyces sp. NPDC057302]|uniref:hypothetical protein n=1 Tax=Streptomyces sp. NPDC057302 TaxID=3346094 RepID=UPI0036290BFC